MNRTIHSSSFRPCRGCGGWPSARPWSGGRATVACAAGIVLLAGCNVGPRYVRPSAPVPADFKEAHAAALAGTWQPARPQDAAPKGPWWDVFHEPELDALEQQLDINNQTIAQYFENFMAVRAQVDEARAAYFPTIAAIPSYTHTWSGGGSSGSNTKSAAIGITGGTTAVPTGGAGNADYFSIAAQASWAPDLWGRVRNSVRASRYAAQVSAADLENVRLTEQAALAAYYFELRGEDTLQGVYDRTIAADRQSVEYARAQAQAGVGADLAVAQAQVTLANAEATATGTAIRRASFEHAIATLIGKPASAFAMPVRALSSPVPLIPVGVPSELLERRPDIAAAERTLAQANALIGVQEAAFYPSLNLTGSGGMASSALGTLFSAPTLFWSLGASLAQTVFDGGLRSATVAQYTALYKADVAAYRQTVLTAFQQVEDGIATLRVLSDQMARQEEAVQAAQRYLEIAAAQYETGISPYLNVITAQGLLLGDEQTLVTLRVNEMTAAVQLVQALGGGWDVKRLPG